MVELVQSRARRLSSPELRTRVIAAINQFIAASERERWRVAFTSTTFHLAIDDEYRVSIWERSASSNALFLFSVPLGLLDIDPWAVELGGGVKDAALDGAAHAVVRAFERPKWWVP